MNVTKAIIPVAGWGTRMLPITKAIEKCMLPVGTRPVIDYVVQDVLKAGIKDIYFVVLDDTHPERRVIVCIQLDLRQARSPGGGDAVGGACYPAWVSRAPV